MDMEHLTKPLISSRTPCGDDLTFSEDFDEILEARRHDDPTISQGEWVTQIKEADWREVVRISERLLSEKSKDLRIAAWLTEALCKTEGLYGLADGYSLTFRLCSVFWDDIHPLPEDGEMEQRAGILDWLAQNTARLIRETPVTKSDKGTFSLIDLESARATAKRMEQNPRDSEAILNAATTTLDNFEASVRDTPGEEFVRTARAAKTLRRTIENLNRLLDERMGAHAPSFGSSFEALEEVDAFLKRHCETKPDAVAPSEKASPSRPPSNASIPLEKIEPAISDMDEINAPQQPFRPVRTREQAVRQLYDIASFFRQTEPHSPVAYLAEKAAKWSDMPLHVWLRCVVKDNSSLMHMEELLGVDKPEDAQN